MNFDNMEKEYIIDFDLDENTYNENEDLICCNLKLNSYVIKNELLSH